MYDQAMQALTKGDCYTAIYYTELLYNSAYTTNDIRLLRSSAHACNAGLNFFAAVDDLSTANLSGGGTSALFTLTTQMFPYISRYGLDSSFYAMDAVHSILRPGFVPSASNGYNSGSYNPASVSSTDRTDTSNLYTMLVGMVTMGSTQNAYGAPNALFHKTTNLPWTTPALLTTDGCAYAGAILNTIEASNAVSSVATGTLKTQLQAISTNLATVINTACDQGCTGVLATGCALAAGTCNPCPAQIRQRSGCTTQAEMCAAAGIVIYVNNFSGW